MPKHTELIDNSLDLIDQKTATFREVVPSLQKRLFGIIQKEALKLETDSQGRIKPTVANLKIRNSIAVKLRKLMKDPKWVKAVTEFNKGFKGVAKIQDKWYDSIDRDAI